MLNCTYVLITPARDEGKFIEGTIESVVRQTVRPVKWIIVSDGSTDSTDEIVKHYAAKHRWIEFVRLPERRERHFAGKVHAFNAGYEEVKDVNYDIIGNLDADITFDEDYMCFLLCKFIQDPWLGVAGTPFREGSEQYDYRFSSVEHVSGACQLFRRECFVDIGGYVPLKTGGIDLVAVLSARMKGWQTRTFTEKTCEHHKRTQSGRHKPLIDIFKSGYQNYRMGSHPIWHIFRSGYQMSKRPFIRGGVVLLAGYFWAMLTRAKRTMSNDLVAFRRREQMRRLKDISRRVLLPRSRPV